MDVFDLVAKISLDTSEYDRGLSAASEKTNSAFGSIQKTGETLKTVGSTLTQNVTMPILDFGKYTLETAANFQAGMSEVQAISGATGSEMESLKAKGLEMASQTKFSTSEVAEAYKYMAMAGWDAGQMVDGLSGIMYLAGASGEDLATTSDIVTDAITAFGLTSGDSGRFVDVLAAASTNANTNVGLLGESFKYVAPLAGAMNYSIEDVAIALGLMANTGIKAGTAGAQLRNIITNMANPTETMASAMDALGVSLTDTDGNMYSLMEVMEQLREGFGSGTMDSQEFSDAMNKLQTSLESGEITAEEYEGKVNDLAIAMYGAEGAQKAQLAASLAGKESMAGLLAIVNAAPEDFDKMTKSVYGSNGAAEDMYEIMNDNAKGAVTMLMSAIDVLAESLGEFLIPAFTEVVRWVTDVVNWFNSLDDGTKKLILTIGGIVAVVGPLLSGFGTLVTVLGSLGPAVSALGAVFGALTSPIGLVIAAVAAVAGGLIYLWNTNEDFRNAVKGIWDNIVGFFQAAGEKIQQAWSAIVDFFQGVWDGIVNIFQNVGQWFSDVFSAASQGIQNAWQGITDFFQGIWDAITGVFEGIGEFFSNLFGGAWETVKETTSNAWDGITTFLGDTWEGLKETSGNIFDNIKDGIGRTWEGVKETTSQVWDGLTGWLGDTWDWLTGKSDESFEATSQTIKEKWLDTDLTTRMTWDELQKYVGDVWQGMQKGAEEKFKAIYDSVHKNWESADEDSKSTWAGIESVLGGTWAGLEATSEIRFDAMKANVETAWQEANTSTNTEWGTLVTTVGNKALEALTAVGDNFGKMEGTVVEKLGLARAAAKGVSFYGVGESIVEGMSAGVREKAYQLANSVENAANMALAVARKAIQSNSPSKVFRKKIGWSISEGMAVGVEDKEGQVVNSILSITDSIQKAFDPDFAMDFPTASVPMDFTPTRFQYASPYGMAGNGADSPVKAAGSTTVNIYSPVAVDAIQAAREWKKTTQKLAMGF